MQSDTDVLDRPELIFALVGPAGVRLDDLSRVLKEHLKHFGYKAVDIRLSSLLANFTGWKPEPTPEPDKTEYLRITHAQSMAYELRKKLGGSALARAGIAAIREQRRDITGSPDKAAPSLAYVIRQLKHPDEVDLLRQVYGASLVVLAGHAPSPMRVETLAKSMAQFEHHPVNGNHRGYAELVIHVDEKQPGDDDLGQNTRDTYPLADFFADLGSESGEYSLTRFIDLLFGHPFHTPMPDEFAMYQASAGSLHSSDESRQVGAVIVEFSKGLDGRTRSANVVASGMNEVPRRGGVLYGKDDSPDGRDQWQMAYKQVDHARRIKIEALEELIDSIKSKKWLDPQKQNAPSNQLANELFPALKGTHFMNIGEFGRTVHAEMSALIDGARRGVAVRGLAMYVTAFPCHNCAKHIIAAGLKRVIYLEPYPKSKADILHGDEIDSDPVGEREGDERVAFFRFTGVAPRQYGRVFSMSARGRKKHFALGDWSERRSGLSPRYVLRNASAAYLLAEREELNKLPANVYRWDKDAICPVSSTGS